MEKTKLGLSVRLVGALCFLMCLFGGYTPALLLTGYILLCETDDGLKKTAITSVLLLVLFSAVTLVIGLIPDIMDVFEAMAAIFDEYLGVRFIDNIASFSYQWPELRCMAPNNYKGG